MAKERKIYEPCPPATKYTLWYQGFKRCFRSLDAARRAQKALSWHEQQGSRITADGQDVE